MPKSRLQSLRKKLDRLTSEYIRRKAADKDGYVKCITCGVVKPWKELQAGHFLSRKYNVGRYMEENIHPQCPACNVFGRGRYKEYTLYMIDMYGREFVDELLGKKHEPLKLTVPMLEDMIAETKRKLEDL